MSDTPTKEKSFSDAYNEQLAVVADLKRELAKAKAHIEGKHVDFVASEEVSNAQLVVDLTVELHECQMARDELLQRLQDRTAAYEAKDARQVKEIQELRARLEAIEENI